jgi:flagellar biosynthesis/type III secretory pathway protein FliH
VGETYPAIFAISGSAAPRLLPTRVDAATWKLKHTIFENRMRIEYRREGRREGRKKGRKKGGKEGREEGGKEGGKKERKKENE